MHDLTLIKTSVTRFVGTGGFLIKYTAIEINTLLIKEVPRLFFNKTLFLTFKNN